MPSTRTSWSTSTISRTSHSALHFNGGPNRIDHAPELGEEPVPGVLYDPAAMLPDFRIDQLAEMRLQPFVRPILIRSHQARVPRHIGGEDRGEAADRRHDLSGGRLA
jgi:hypothetical protein